MQLQEEKEIGARLRAQSRAQSLRLDDEFVDVPTAAILSRHRRRRIARRSAALSCMLLLVCCGIWFAPRDSDSIQFRTPEMASRTRPGALGRVESNQNESGKQHESEELLQELVKFVSMQSGAEAQLVMQTDERGVTTPVIYIPPVLLPIEYENLDATEQQAVRRVLNQSTEDWDSI